MYRDINENDKFESIEEFLKEFDINGCEYRFEYNGEEYQTCWSNGKFSISDCIEHGKWWAYDTIDEMLDNFKAKNGKTMREFILDVDGAF